MTPEERRQYRQGMCDAMALALHELTGLPLVKIVGLKKNRDPLADFAWCEEPVHVAVGSRQLWIDVDGAHDRIPRERLRFSMFKPERVSMRQTDVEEVTYLYTMSGVSRAEINSARHAALKDRVLGPIIRELTKPTRVRR